MKKLRSKQGFTLIEVVVVMAIIAILALLVVGAITVARRAARETAHRANGKSIQAGFEAYFASNKIYPAYTNVNFNSTSITGSDTGQLNVKIDAGSTSCGNGGGTVNSTTKRYDIYVAKEDCTGTAASNLEAISGP